MEKAERPNLFGEDSSLIILLRSFTRFEGSWIKEKQEQKVVFHEIVDRHQHLPNYSAVEQGRLHRNLQITQQFRFFTRQLKRKFDHVKA